MANPDLYIKPALPDRIFPWENYDPQTREEIDEFLKAHNISKVDLIYAGYETLKQNIQK